jgi:hypothetical protein
MSEDEAKRFGVDLDEKKDYVRLDRAKSNIVRRSIKASWLRMVSVGLNNATELYPDGDEVQAIERWVPAKAWAGVTSVMISMILADIDKGMPNGQRYSDANAASARVVWPVVQRHCPGHNEAQCREVIKTWRKSGVLYSDEYDDPIERKPRKGLYVNYSKKATGQEEDDHGS